MSETTLTEADKRRIEEEEKYRAEAREDSSVWQKILSSDETIEKEFGLGEKFIKYSLIFWLIIGVILFFASSRIGLFIIAIVLFYFLFYIKKAYQYALTNKRLLAKRGWLSTSLISIEYEKITDILVKQGFLDKSFFDVGVLAINTAGTGGHELIMKNIGEPYRVKQELYEKIEQSKEVYKGKKQSGQTNGGIDDLEKLAKLKEKGIITQEEFEAKKKQVLGL